MLKKEQERVAWSAANAMLPIRAEPVPVTYVIRHCHARNIYDARQSVSVFTVGI